MGSSYIEYRGRGMWATDGTVEKWLLHLIDAARPDLPREAWLRQATEHWHLQATAGFIGCVDAGLDQYLNRDPAREAAFLIVLDRLTDDLSRTPDPPAGPVRGDGVEPPPDIRGLLRRVTTAVAGIVRGDTDGTDDPPVLR